MSLWKDALPLEQQPRCERSIRCLTAWLEKAMTHDGAWNPLWFGDQDAQDEKNPVYGAATIIDYLQTAGVQVPSTAKDFLLSCQNADGGWGGNKGVSSKVTLTAKALCALKHYRPACEEAISRGIDYLYAQYEAGSLYRREPIGLYFSRLWYSEQLYNYTYLIQALRQ